MSRGAPGGETDGEPRARFGPWLMAALRLGVGGLVAARSQALLLAPGVPLALRLPLAAALTAGLVAFAWPRTCLIGLALLAAGLAAAEALARHLGLAPAPAFLSSLAILAVLGAGEWLKGRLGGRG